MGACTSDNSGAAVGKRDANGRIILTEAQKAMQRQMIIDFENEQDREVAARIANEKAILRKKAMPVMKASSSSDNLEDMLVAAEDDKSDDKEGTTERLRLLEEQDKQQLLSMDVLKTTKQLKRRQAKLDAEADSKWMIFRDLDAFDEADMVKVAKFMDSLMKVSGQISQQNDEDETDETMDNGAVSQSMRESMIESHRLLEEVELSPLRMKRKGASQSQNLSSPSDKRSTLGELANARSSMGAMPDKANSGTPRMGSVDRDSEDDGNVMAKRTMSVGQIGADLPSISFDALRASGGLKTPNRKPRSGSMDFVDSASKIVPQGSAGKSIDDDDQPIQFSRENSFNSLLKKGQLVITPTTAMSGSKGGRLPKIGTPLASADNEDSLNRSSHSVSSTTSSAGDGETPTYMEKQLKSTSDLRNFMLPPGFVTPLVAKAVVDVFKQGGKLHKDSVQKLLRSCYRSFQTLPNTTKMTVKQGERLTIVGDIHGQLPDLLYIIESSGLPSATNKYIFNGDFVDRGVWGVEVMCILMALYLSCPNQVTLNRGNHEDFAICCAYGFQAECCAKYDEVTFGMFVEVFSYLPLFATINETIFILHGGLFHTANVTLKELDKIKRTDFSLKDIPEGGDDVNNIPRDQTEAFLKQLQRDALWSDPSINNGLAQSPRGAGVLFGPDVARAFCAFNGIKMVVRSHECCRTGFDLPFQGSLVEGDKNLVATVFSASNYSGGGSNSAAYIVFQFNSDKPEAPSAAEISSNSTITDDAGEGEGEEAPTLRPRAITRSRQRLHVLDVPLEEKNQMKTTTTFVKDTDLKYDVHYFHIDGEEAERYKQSSLSELYDDDDDDDTASVDTTASLTGDLSLHELILRKRKLLHKHFELNDPESTGYVLKSTWMEVMQRVLSLHISWENLFTNLVDEESIEYLETDSAGRIDPKAPPKSTIFVKYSKFLNDFSLSLENGSEDDDSTEVGGQGNKRTSMQGALVDSLYAHHNELSAIFSFFDQKKDNVISKEEFREGCRLVRNMNGESDEGEGFNKECDQLMEIMDLNGAGSIDINEFFEMFRVSEAMKKKMSASHPTHLKSTKRRNSVKSESQTPQFVDVGSVKISAD